MFFRYLFFCFVFLFNIAYTNAQSPFSVDTSAEYVIINKIFIEGNNVTKEHIITRELAFSENDTVFRNDFEKKLEQSKNNLMNTSLFNFVNTSITLVEIGKININIKVTERWYTWPTPLFEIAETNFNTWWQGKNFSRTNYGFYIVRENFRGRRETLRFKFRFGYSQQLALQYLVPYINKKQNIGLGITSGFSRNHEINYRTLNNKRMFYKDVSNFVREEFYARATQTYRKGLYFTNTFELQYSRNNVADTISYLISDYFHNNSTQTQFLSAIWKMKYDKRDYRPYPLKGYYIGLDFSKHGLGIINDNNLNVLFSYLNFRYYTPIAGRLFFASGIYSKFSLLAPPPYYIQQGMGYGDYVRGYELYVIDGQNYGLMRNNIKVQLVKPRKTVMPFFSSEKFNTIPYSFYLNCFADVGYVSDRLYAQYNFLANKPMVGIGAGLDFVTYYDQVLGMHFAWNQLGQTGFFINFVKSI
jgi:outer membrane protein assembly factor BamA